MDKKSYLRFLGRKKDKFLILDDDELYHAKVRRIKRGEIIEVNTLDGNIYLGKVIDINKKFLKAEIINKLEEEITSTSIHLYLVAPNKLSKVDSIIEPLSELGVNSLTVVIGKFTAVGEKDISKKMDKWKKKALNSIKQCKRTYPLKIKPTLKLMDIEASSHLNIVFYEKERRNSLKDFIGKSFRSVSIVIGNEAGFDEKEIKFLKERGFITLSLGKNTLKMETAILVSISQLMLLLED